MKDFVSQVARFTAKLTVFYIFLLFFGMLIFYVFIKPAYTSLVQQQTFSVDAVAKRNFTPDTATVSTGATLEGADVKTLQNKAQTQLDGALSALEQLGISSEKISSNYSIDPKYDEDYVNIIGYRANATLSVKTNDFEQIDSILDIALQNDFNRIYGVSFDFEDPVAIRESLRQEAIETAKAKAEKIAEESGLRLGKLINVYEGSYSYPMYEKYNVNSFAADMAYAEEVPQSSGFTPGESEIQMQMTLIYEVL